MHSFAGTGAPTSSRILSLLAGLWLLASQLPAGAAESVTARHMGVATCASTTCHGAARPLEGTTVLQHEYVVWSRFDPHATAFTTLRNERSAAMVRRLGMGPAEQEPACLACHTEVVPAAAQGPRFQADDGIGCESCHGASGRWLAVHDDATPEARAESRTLGLRRLEDPRVLAATCSGCHVAGPGQMATHAMMAAGHPRLSFELDTFTELWRTSGGREHFRRDVDYLERRVAGEPVQTWLIGLAEAATRSVDALQAGSDGSALPEFATFNCYSCHRSMGLDAWQERTIPSGLKPGELRIDDTALRLLATALRPVAPEHSRSLAGATDALQKSATANRSTLPATATEVRRHLVAIVDHLHRSPPSAAEHRLIRDAVISAARGGAYPDYASAEQAAMAVVLLMAETGMSRASHPDMEGLFSALANDENFDQQRFARMLERAGSGVTP